MRSEEYERVLEGLRCADCGHEREREAYTVRLIFKTEDFYSLADLHCIEMLTRCHGTSRKLRGM